VDVRCGEVITALFDSSNFGCPVPVDCPIAKAPARDLVLSGSKQEVNRIAVFADDPVYPAAGGLGTDIFQVALDLDMCFVQPSVPDGCTDVATEQFFQVRAAF
jgi:hypothetical protein